MFRLLGIVTVGRAIKNSVMALKTPTTAISSLTEEIKMSNSEVFRHAVPYNLEAERAILGAILLDNLTINQAIEVLRSDMFFAASNERIYGAMLRLREIRQAIDPITLQSELKRSGNLDFVGGAATIGALLDGVPRFSNIQEYVGIVLETWRLRSLIKASQLTIEQSISGELPSGQIIASLSEATANIVQSETEKKPERIGLLSQQRLTAYERAASSDKLITGLATGFSKLDNTLSGFGKQLHYIAARPGVGKTAFACTIAYKIADNPGNDNPVVLFFSIESNREQITDRLNAMRARVNGPRMRAGILNKAEWRAVAEAEQYWQDKRIVIDGRTTLTVPILKAVAAQVKHQYGRLDLVLIDYCQRMTPHKTSPGMSRTTELQYISTGLQAAQKELDTCIVGFLQADRAIEKRANKRIMLSDLRESGTWEQDGRVILSLYREKAYDPDADDLAEIAILKNNEGAAGLIEKVTFQSGISMFEPIITT